MVGGTIGSGSGEELVHHARLEVDEKRSGDVVKIVGLVEENVFAVVDEGTRRSAGSRRRAVQVVRASVVGMGGIRGMNGHQSVLVVGIGGEIAKLAVRLDAVLEAQLLPEFAADLVAALAYLEGDDFAGHGVDCLEASDKVISCLRGGMNKNCLPGQHQRQNKKMARIIFVFARSSR